MMPVHLANHFALPAGIVAIGLFAGIPAFAQQSAPAQQTAAPQGYKGTVNVAPGANGENTGALTNVRPKAKTASATQLKSEDNQGAASIHNTNANNYQAKAQLPSQRNPLLADNGDVRIAKLIGTSVYNTDDKKLGEVEDVLMGASGQPQVILQIEGKSKEVAVPWNKLTFGDAKASSDNTVLISGVTKQALDQLPAYHDHDTKSG